MKNIRFIYVVILTFFLAGSIAGCGSSGSGGGDGPSTGILNLSITDAPVEGASKVVVKFTGVDLHHSSGNITHFDFSPPKQIDLLALNGGGSEVILDNEVLPSGDYQWVRLNVEAVCDTRDSFIEFNNDQTDRHSIWIPSGEQSGLKLVRGFNLPADGVADFTIDFDLRKSVHLPAGNGPCADNYKLKPALRLVNNTEVGSIAGTIDTSLINDDTCTEGNVVYVFQGHGITPDDIDAIAPDPVTTAMVKLDDNEDYVYRASFLNAGDYTIAFTCQADGDDPELSDPIAFVGTKEVSVTAGVVTIHNFQ